MMIPLCTLILGLSAGPDGSAHSAPPSLPIATTAPAQETDPGSKLTGGLAGAFASASQGELLPVAIVLSEQAPATLMAEARSITSKVERRAYVSTVLRDIARDTQSELLGLLEAGRAEGRVERARPLWIANVISARVDLATALDLAARGDVARVHYDRPRGEEVLSMLPAQPVGGVVECGVDLMGADEVWSQYGITGAGVVVGVIDTGLCLGHPDIQNQVWRNPCEIAGNGQDDDGNGYVDDINGWNFESDNNNVNDNNGHGSHVSGTVAGDGTGGNQSGMAPDADVMALKFWNSLSGEASVWEAMQYAVTTGADVTTASLGWQHSWGPDRATWRAVCDNTIAAGLVVVYAAGNEGCGNPPDNVRTPGDVPAVLTVGATDCNDNAAWFTSCGPVTWQNVPPYNDYPYPPGLMKPSVAAPGYDTLSHYFCNGYTPLSGTSMATPHVSGACALILQADPTLDHFGVRNLLMSTAVDLGSPGADNTYGAGRVNVFAAVTAALANGNYCEAKLNSCGTLAEITSTGQSSASATSGFVLSGTNAHANELGILAYTDAGRRYPPLPFFGGDLCINSPIRRGPVVVSNGTPGLCDGTYELDMNAFASGNAGGFPAAFLLVPGTVVDCQWWGRDGAGIYLTQALTYTVCP